MPRRDTWLSKAETAANALEETPMIDVRVTMKVKHQPLKRVPVMLQLDADTDRAPIAYTDRDGIAHFDLTPTTGKVLVAEVERYQGHLEGEIAIELWSLTQSESPSEGAPGEFPNGSNAYPSMETRVLPLARREVCTDSEGYLVNPADWSEDFARAQATAEGLTLGEEQWEVIRYLRRYYADHGVQVTVRDMVKHFRALWGPERGSSRYLHRLFPRGGPQKQGNRLAGLLRTKGEH
jgi:tRNA 2-thiouridine synthesizing protein E